MTGLAVSGTLDIFLRLAAAALAGSLIGFNRELRGKPAGLRTHALVSLGSALLVVVLLGAPGFGADAVSRVIQGVVTGIGFLGAGVILHKPTGRITGLTSAAMIWIAAAFGVAAGLGRWFEMVAALVLVVLVLLLEFVEHRMGRHAGSTETDSNGEA